MNWWSGISIVPSGLGGVPGGRLNPSHRIYSLASPVVGARPNNILLAVSPVGGDTNRGVRVTLRERCRTDLAGGLAPARSKNRGGFSFDPPGISPLIICPSEQKQSGRG